MGLRRHHGTPPCLHCMFKRFRGAGIMTRYHVDSMQSIYQGAPLRLPEPPFILFISYFARNHFIYFIFVLTLFFIFRKTVAIEAQAMAWALFIHSIHLLYLLHYFI